RVELAQEPLREAEILDVEDTVVDLREAAAVPTQLLRQPLAPIDTDLDREGQPRLHADMHQAEIMVPVVEIQMRAPTFAGDQLQAPRLSIPAHPKRPAPFHALKDRNQPVAHAIARQNLAGAILFADLPPGRCGVVHTSCRKLACSVSRPQEWRYTRHFARRSRNHRAGPTPSRFLPRFFDIATIWLRLRRAGFFVALRAFVRKVIRRR